MAVSRQSDSVWAAMGYGRQHSPARDEDHHGLGPAARRYGEALGRKHAGESIREYHRDAQGRFAPMPHHEQEHEREAGRVKREHRDAFRESYHHGFRSKVKEHEAEEKDRANKTSMVRVVAAIRSSDIPHEQWRQLPKHHKDAIMSTETRDDMAPEFAAAGHDMDWQHGKGWAQKGRYQHWEGNCRNCGANVMVGPNSTSSTSLGRDARDSPCAGLGTGWQNDMLIEHRRGRMDAAVDRYVRQVQDIDAQEKEDDSDWLRGIGVEGSRKTSALVVEAIHLDPHTGEVVIEDPGRFQYRLEHGGSDEGYVEPAWLDSMVAESPRREQWRARQPTERNPYRYDTDTLKNIANDPAFGLSLGMSDRAPFSRRDVGTASGDRGDATYAPLRPGEITSRPIQVEDYLGNTHTFVHHVTAPNLNPLDEAHPERGGSWVVSLHHHVNRPSGTSEWLPSEVSHHVSGVHGVRGRASDDLLKDIWGQLNANSDMVSMYGAGAQRVGDKNTSVEYEFRHPEGDIVYNAKLANGHNAHDGYYYDPNLPERHEDRASLGGKSRWIITGRSKQMEYPFDADGPSRMTTVEGSDHPSDRTVSYDLDDLPGVIKHVWNGLGVNPTAPAWRRWNQHKLPNTQGRPPESMTRSYSIRPWTLEQNIHRSAERLPFFT